MYVHVHTESLRISCEHKQAPPETTTHNFTEIENIVANCGLSISTLIRRTKPENLTEQTKIVKFWIEYVAFRQNQKYQNLDYNTRLDDSLFVKLFITNSSFFMKLYIAPRLHNVIEEMQIFAEMDYGDTYRFDQELCR